MADLPNFCARFFHGVLELHVIQIDAINASQLSGIVELGLFSTARVDDSS